MSVDPGLSENSGRTKTGGKDTSLTTKEEKTKAAESIMGVLRLFFPKLKRDMIASWSQMNPSWSPSLWTKMEAF